ncbi:glycosyltransferase [Paramixta manurensis]|uniref:Glycosyltransferase n=1 Tax=Paramixta manurensis TaxID=2740817 RepID=A0A6M8UAN5_9GAMM|nr:glycosyltransferase [Erwiniaceae bacterium PD-1]
MNEPKTRATLSVVIPVYNVQRYLALAVDSVLNQTVQPEEIIIVDDGSTDGSGDLAESLYGALEHVTIIHTENQGLGEARNVGTRAATCDYLYYFDSDDILVDDLVERFHQVVAQHPNTEVYAFSAESFIDPLADDAAAAEATKLPRYRRGMEATFSSGEEAFNQLSQRAVFYPNAWLYVYSRRVQVENGLFFKPIIHEDEEFTPRMFFAAGETVVTDRVFFKRRVRPGSIMNSGRSEKNIIGYLSSIDAIESLLVNSRNQVSRNNLRQRIILNIINIMLIKKASRLQLSPETQQKYNRVYDKYANIMSKIAGFNFFLYRVLRFGLRKMRLVAS